MQGWGLDGVWADDFHHVVRRMIAGDQQGYYADYAGTAAELATVLRQGWLYTGAHSAHLQRPRGTDPAHVPMDRFVVCLQNHDQIGNRALGDRLHQQIAAESWRAASVLLLTAPMTPLLFMGQEWAASTPFQYFTDLEPTLGSRVTQGRRNEFAAFPEYSSEDVRERIPDPQAKSTFERSRLAWDERSQDDHRRSLALYRALLALRRDHQALAGSDAARAEAVAADQQSVVLRRSDDRETFWVVASLRTSAEVDLVSAAATVGADLRDTTLELVLDTEHGEYTADPLAIDTARPSTDTTVRFQRAGAVILRQR
jgi:maltooligosyltrehalose trehalohydrolase